MSNKNAAHDTLSGTGKILRRSCMWGQKNCLTGNVSLFFSQQSAGFCDLRLRHHQTAAAAHCDEFIALTHPKGSQGVCCRARRDRGCRS